MLSSPSAPSLLCDTSTCPILQWRQRRNVIYNPPNPAHCLPASLETLRLSECTEATSNLIKELCLAKKKKSLPKIRIVELFYRNDADTVQSRCLEHLCPDALLDLRKMCKDAEIEPQVCFAPKDHIMGISELASWSILENRELFCAQLGCQAHAHVVRSDAVGYIMMRDVVPPQFFTGGLLMYGHEPQV